MKQKYSNPRIEIVELKLGRSVLTEQSGGSVPSGGQGDNSRHFNDRYWDED